MLPEILRTDEIRDIVRDELNAFLIYQTLAEAPAMARHLRGHFERGGRFPALWIDKGYSESKIIALEPPWIFRQIAVQEKVHARMIASLSPEEDVRFLMDDIPPDITLRLVRTSKEKSPIIEEGQKWRGDVSEFQARIEDPSFLRLVLVSLIKEEMDDSDQYGYFVCDFEFDRMVKKVLAEATKPDQINHERLQFLSFARGVFLELQVAERQHAAYLRLLLELMKGAAPAASAARRPPAGKSPRPGPYRSGY